MDQPIRGPGFGHVHSCELCLAHFICIVISPLRALISIIEISLSNIHLFLAASVPLTDGANKTGGQVPTTISNSKKIGSGKANEQRYFRIPFLRPNDRNRDTTGEQKKKGWWYAHFDGKIFFVFISCFK